MWTIKAECGSLLQGRTSPVRRSGDFKVEEAERVSMRVEEPERVSLRVEEPERVSMRVEEAERVSMRIEEAERVSMGERAFESHQCYLSATPIDS